jgi:FkbM family methyltransferase
MGLARILARIPSTTFLGSVARIPLRLIPRGTVAPILRGPLRGRKWIVGSGVHGYWWGTYEPEMQSAVRRTVTRGAVFFDVGAHAGYYSLLASRLVTATGRVVAFEPDTRNLGYLKEHLRLNRAGNVTVIQAAVADASGTEHFAAEQSGFGGALSGVGSVTVTTATINGLVGAGTVPTPAYLKIDVEGAEFRVLCGARKVLRSAQPTIFLAVHTPAVERLCGDALATLGYVLRPITRDAWLCVPPSTRG